MEIKEISLAEYDDIFKPYHIFNSVGFNALTANSQNVDLLCLAFKTSKMKLGVIGGVINNKFLTPFSAPFGGFSYVKDDVSLEQIDEAVDALLQYGNQSGWEEINCKLPPLVYQPSFLSKVSSTLFRKGFSIGAHDLNYSIDISGSLENYLSKLQKNARKNLAIAKTKEFILLKCQSLEEKKCAYDIISENRKAKGYPLRMTFEALRETVEVVKADFFLLKKSDDLVASAIIFHSAPKVVQVIYWGDLPEFGSDKPMNFLSFAIVKHYIQEGKEVIDIGPSTEASNPNYGLCSFKESIGCDVYPKYSFKYEYRTCEFQ